MEQIGKLIVITGATVSGKDTVVSELLKINPYWKKVVTTTTRPIRLGEQNGIDYHFVNLETFRQMENNGEFLESVEYAGNKYGTTKTCLDELLKGYFIIWIIDATRASKINKLFDDCFDKKTANYFKINTKVIYLKLPDNSTRKKHFLKRKMGKTDIDKRMEQDEMNLHLGNFKNVVTNYDGKLEETVNQVEKIINT